jgi:hypothetical protein
MREDARGRVGGGDKEIDRTQRSHGAELRLSAIPRTTGRRRSEKFAESRSYGPSEKSRRLVTARGV